MGVRGLTTFFNNNPDLSKPYKLHDTHVIIDGNNLIHLLYFSSKADFMYGGEYPKYAKSIKKYFTAYLECNIKPIVIFDGGYDKSDRKFRTIMMRSKNRLSLTNHIVKYGDCNGGVLPINAKLVFRDVITEMGISIAQSEFEADDQVTALANHYNCPVLSNDSDFYIFNISHGFISLSSVEPHILEETIKDSDSFKYLHCSIYYIDNFLSYFPGIDRNVLPLFGTLVGNDFVNSKDFSKFFASVRFPKHKSRGLRTNERQKKIIGLLSWLANCSLSEGIKQVLTYAKKERKEYLNLIINRSINGYETPECNLTYIIDGHTDALRGKIELEPYIKTPCGQNLPVPFVIAFHLGLLQPFFLNILNLHRTFLQTQVESIVEKSAHDCSQYIRQIIYGILSGHLPCDEKVHQEECLCAIEEYDRRTGHIVKNIVSPIHVLNNGEDLPSLEDLYLMKKNYLKAVLSSVLVKDALYLQSLPDSLELLFVCINYWLNNCSPKPKEDIVHALTISIIYFQVLKRKAVKQESTLEHNSKNTNVSSNFDANPIISVMNKISDKEAQFALQNIKKYTQKPVLNRRNPLIIHIIHSFSQLQSCILYSSYLNNLLNCPFLSLKLQDILSGTLIYNLTKNLLERPFPELFISELLGRQSRVNELYLLLKSKVFDCICEDYFAKQDRTHLKKSKKGCKSNLKQSNEKDNFDDCAVGVEPLLEKRFDDEILSEVFI